MIKILAIAALRVIGYAVVGLACLGSFLALCMWVTQWVDWFTMYCAALGCWLFGYTVWQCAKEDIAKYKQDKGNRS